MSRKKDETIFSESINSFISSTPNLIEAIEDKDLTTVEQLQTVDENEQFSTDDLELSKFRKLNIELLDAEDKKYTGLKVSRNSLKDDDPFGTDSSDVELSSEESLTADHVESDDQEGEESCEEEILKSDSGESSDEESDGEDTEDVTLLGYGEKPDDFQETFLKSSSDVEKGIAVRNQITLWDLLLECRIKFQKCLMASNQLPQLQQLDMFSALGGTEFQTLLSESQSNLRKLLSSLLKLEELTLKQNPEVNLKINKGKKHFLDKSSESDEDSELHTTERSCKKLKISDISETIFERHEQFQKYRDETIQKWNDRTRIGQISNKNFSAFEQSTVKQIEHILQDKSRLIKRTQLKRSIYNILGQDHGGSPAKQQKLDDEPTKSDGNMNEYNNEIFDDDDFYHQLLRELLERKSSDVTDPIQLGKQWIQLQKLRSKMKRKIDVRATKGRKIKYVVHPKLVNFMMPILDNVWNEDAKSELFNSLFGKNKA